MCSNYINSGIWKCFANSQIILKQLLIGQDLYFENPWNLYHMVSRIGKCIAGNLHFVRHTGRKMRFDFLGTVCIPMYTDIVVFLTLAGDVDGNKCISLLFLLLPSHPPPPNWTMDAKQLTPCPPICFWRFHVYCIPFVSFSNSRLRVLWCLSMPPVECEF